MAEKVTDEQSSGIVLIIRILGLLIMLAGMALIVIPILNNSRNTLDLFAFIFSGVGLIAMGYGLLQLYLWGCYLLFAADGIAVISLIITFTTLPFFKSFFIVVCLIVLGFFLVNRNLFTQGKRL